MSNPVKKGIETIDKVLEDFKNKGWPPKKTILIEGLRNFGDTLHSSVVVRHYRKTYPNHNIIWGITEKYWEQFNEYAQVVGVVVFPLPHAEPEHRQKWKKHCDNLNLFKSIFPLCAVSGWNVAGNIVDNVLHNAGITKLAVPRRPFFPHGIQDYQWHDQFIIKNGLKGTKYVLLEYNSFTLSKPPHECVWPIEKYNELVKLIKVPVIYTAHKEAPPLDGGIDARGCTWKQAKVLIERAGCMIGCGSGLSVLAACEGLNKYVVEINIGPPLALKGIYGIKSISVKTQDPQKIAGAINRLNLIK